MDYFCILSTIEQEATKADLNIFFKASHMLLPRDIEHIPSGIKKAKLRKDKNRKRTFEYTFERKGNKKEFVKICIQIDKEDSRIAIVKTIFVSKNDK